MSDFVQIIFNAFSRSFFVIGFLLLGSVLGYLANKDSTKTIIAGAIVGFLFGVSILILHADLLNALENIEFLLETGKH